MLSILRCLNCAKYVRCFLESKQRRKQRMRLLRPPPHSHWLRSHHVLWTLCLTSYPSASWRTSEYPIRVSRIWLYIGWRNGRCVATIMSKTPRTGASSSTASIIRRSSPIRSGPPAFNAGGARTYTSNRSKEDMKESIGGRFCCNSHPISSRRHRRIPPANFTHNWWSIWAGSKFSRLARASSTSSLAQESDSLFGLNLDRKKI